MTIQCKIPLSSIESIISQLVANNKCSVCYLNQGLLLQCESGCESKIHFYCAKKTKYIKSIKDPDDMNHLESGFKYRYRNIISIVKIHILY